MNLAAFQSELLRAVRFSDTSAALGEQVTGAGTLTPLAAIEVYRQMYWYRLVDAHFALFPRTAVLMGKKRFTEAACACLAVQPSQVPVLELLATPFASYMVAHAEARAYASLAELEAASVESLLAPDALGARFTAAMTQEAELADMMLCPPPSLRIVRTTRDAFDTYLRIRPDAEATDHGETLSESPAGQELDVVLVRNGFAIDCLSLLDGERALLEQANKGVSVAMLIETLSGPTHDVTRAFARFSLFLEHGMFFLYAPRSP